MCSSSDGFVVTMDALTGEFQNIYWLNMNRTVSFDCCFLANVNNKTTKTIYLLTKYKVS